MLNAIWTCVFLRVTTHKASRRDYCLHRSFVIFVLLAPEPSPWKCGSCMYNSRRMLHRVRGYSMLICYVRMLAGEELPCYLATQQENRGEDKIESGSTQITSLDIPWVRAAFHQMLQAYLELTCSRRVVFRSYLLLLHLLPHAVVISLRPCAQCYSVTVQCASMAWIIVQLFSSGSRFEWSQDTMFYMWHSNWRPVLCCVLQPSLKAEDHSMYSHEKALQGLANGMNMPYQSTLRVAGHEGSRAPKLPPKTTQKHPVSTPHACPTAVERASCSTCTGHHGRIVWCRCLVLLLSQLSAVICWTMMLCTHAFSTHFCITRQEL